MEEIREKMSIVITVIIAIAICGIAIYFFEYHEAVYYTQVDNAKIENISSTDDMKYEYTLDCYNKNGKKREMKFKTSRELREGAYLMLEVKIMGVHSWKEVQYEELPDKVKVKYGE